MWVLFLILSTGTVENFEFSNAESCQHAQQFFTKNVDGVKTECGYISQRSVIEPKEPGQSNEL